MSEPVRTLQVGTARVEIYESKEKLGQAAARTAANIMQNTLKQNEVANVAFATGASQFEFVDALGDEHINWQRIVAFHLDEYLGMQDDHPASFRRWLRERIVERYAPRAVHYVQGDADDAEVEAARYSRLLEQNPVHLGCVGIGENGHIAFNDPPVADFSDPHKVKVVELDHACRMQQLGEGWFPTLDDVPHRALTLTVPAIMQFQHIVSVVPDERKAEAVKNALQGEMITRCPASILRTHPNLTLFLDEGSASLLTV